MDSISCRDQQQSILNPNYPFILQYLRSVDVQGTSISRSGSNLTNGTVMASNYMMFYYSMGACICSENVFWILGYCQRMLRLIFYCIYMIILHIHFGMS